MAEFIPDKKSDKWKKIIDKIYKYDDKFRIKYNIKDLIKDAKNKEIEHEEYPEEPIINEQIIQFQRIPFFQIHGFGGESFEYILNSSYFFTFAPQDQISYSLSEVFIDTQQEKISDLPYKLIIFENIL